MYKKPKKKNCIKVTECLESPSDHDKTQISYLSFSHEIAGHLLQFLKTTMISDDV